MENPKHPGLKKPNKRKLRGYAFDPSLSLKIDTAAINQVIYRISWEDLDNLPLSSIGTDNAFSTPQSAGPIGEYVEVIDYDPTVDKFYKPVDLNDAYILSQDGLAPSESNPQFHQQMVYAVVMTTINNFENALGRRILWSSRKLSNKNIYEEYVQRLRVYPHALREPNAYYSPQKKALLFGYFSASPADKTFHMPDTLIFTCLSHDIIAHETTHAILDGIYPYFNEPSNPDVLAFHEAFADIVALFQHFTFPEVLKHQIAKTKGELGNQNLLGQLAQEFGSGIGAYGSLRDAIGEIDDVLKTWKPKQPTPNEYETFMEPHKRGSILVAAVFEAFITIYKSQVEDLLRIATNGTGVLPQGELHPDLVNRLAKEASKAASHVLTMCIRALDYCPPVDITFGEFLRAIITADLDLVEEDERSYRLAFIDSFRRRGIYPKGIKTLSVESLRYALEPIKTDRTKELMVILSEFLCEYRNAVIHKTDRREIFDISREFIGGNGKEIKGLHERITLKFDGLEEAERLTGIMFSYGWTDLGIRTTKIYEGRSNGPSFQIQNLRVVSRVGPDGNKLNHIVFSMIQRSGVVIETGKFTKHYDLNAPQPSGGLEFRGGCTMIFDLDTLKLKYAISKPLLDINTISKGSKSIDKKRAEYQYNFQFGDGYQYRSDFAKHFHCGSGIFPSEPFALLHKQ